MLSVSPCEDLYAFGKITRSLGGPYAICASTQASRVAVRQVFVSIPCISSD